MGRKGRLEVGRADRTSAKRSPGAAGNSPIAHVAHGDDPEKGLHMSDRVSEREAKLAYVRLAKEKMPGGWLRACGYLTPPRVAELLGVNETKVLAWIRAGELGAVNVALRKGRRPRWRVAQADLEAFLARRSATPPAQVTRRRRRTLFDVIEFF